MVSGNTEVFTHEKESELGSVTLITISNLSSVTSSPISTSVGKFWKVSGYWVEINFDISCIYWNFPMNIFQNVTLMKIMKKFIFLSLVNVFHSHTSENVVMLITTEAELKQVSRTSIARTYIVSVLVTGRGDIKLINPWKIQKLSSVSLHTFVLEGKICKSFHRNINILKMYGLSFNDCVPFIFEWYPF